VGGGFHHNPTKEYVVGILIIDLIQGLQEEETMTDDNKAT
jgi:hypothetical protein